MAINALGWSLFAKVLNFLGRRIEHRPARVLSLGYTDLMISPADIESEMGSEIAEQVIVNSDNAGLSKWHSMDSVSIDTDSLYRALGFDTDYLDVREVRGGELVHDLNEPIPKSMVGSYDLVLDSGTIEHCFNIGQVMRNIATALKVGGLVYHGNPMVMINHGFYNFSPQFYLEFYQSNGFSLMDLFSIEVHKEKYVIERPDLFERIKLGSGNDRTIQVIAKKNEVRDINWPTQTKYRLNPSQAASD
ncbi:MAG: class I SAM-dependent methyltransferase [Rhodospirillaceae bacterium]|nr:class I SAM-dependent methyltransferase [Rhodospirillaceae bacterium]